MPPVMRMKSAKRAGPKSAKALEKEYMARRAVQTRAAGGKHGYNPYRDAHGRFAPGPHKAKGTAGHAKAVVGAFNRARKLAAARGAVKAAATPAVKAHEAVRAKIEKAHRVKDKFYIKSLAEAKPEKVARIASRRGRKEGPPEKTVAVHERVRKKLQMKVEAAVKARPKPEASAKPAVSAAMKARKGLVKKYTEAARSEPAKWARKMKEQKIVLESEVSRLATEKREAKAKLESLGSKRGSNAAALAYEDLVKKHGDAYGKLSAIKNWFVARKEIPHLIPPLPVTSRLKLYKAGEAKIKAIQALHRPKPEWTEAHQREWEQMASKIVSGKTEAEREAAAKRFDELSKLNTRSLGGVDQEARAEAHKLLDLDAKSASKFAAGKPPGSGDPTIEMNEPTRYFAEKGLAWLGSKIFRGSLTQNDVPTGMLDPEAYAKHGNRASGGPAGIRLAPSTKVDTVVHEMGHYIEGNTSAGASSRAFLAHRVGDEAPRPMNDFEGGIGYGDGEMGRKDKFDQYFTKESNAAYVGKHYSSGVTEIMSMGMEALYRDPVKFATKDPEFAKFVIGLMDGSLR